MGKLAEERLLEMVDHMIDFTMDCIAEVGLGRRDAADAIELAVFSALVVLDGESEVNGAEVRPLIEVSDGNWATLENVGGEMHSLFARRFKDRQRGSGGM